MPPPGYVDISTALNTRGFINVIGVSVDVFGDVFKTGGSSLCITFTLKDSNLDNGHSWDGLKVKYFHDDRASLPPVKQHDVVLLQNLRVRTFNGKTVAVASQHETVPWAIYRRESDAAMTASPISGPQPFEPSPLEKKYALSLVKNSAKLDVTGHLRAVETVHARSHTVQASVPSPRSNGPRQFSLIKDLEQRTFVILVCEIVSIYQNDSEKVIIYVTDYTANEGLWNYGNDDDGREGDRFNYMGSHKRKRNGPSGQMTLQVTLWDPHASYARQLESSQFVRLFNVHIKQSRVNQNLEASLHTDRYNPGNVNIRKVDPEKDELARALRDRKKEYWAKHGKKEVSEKDTSTPAKPKKSNKKQQQKKQEPQKEEGQKPLGTNKRTNQNIQAMNPGIKCRPVEDILTIENHNIKSPDGIEYRLPFQNICYRSTIRVVDFFPQNLEDFAVPEESEKARSPGSDDDEENISNNSNGFTRWVWRFCLLVESAGSPPQGEFKKQMPLFVSGPDAVCLLRMDPANLRTNKKALNSMKEKLFILWGDLEERKAKAIVEGNSVNHHSWGPVSSVPFTCCIKEYGVKCSHDSDADDEMVVNHDFGCSHEDCFGWERRFAMFQTTINAS